MKHYRVYTFFSALLVLSRLVCAQAIDNTASFRMVNADAYVRFHYENDFFTAKDYYYTQGMQLEFVHPALENLFLNKILITPKKSAHQFGLALEHNAYTPTSITYNGILYGDRPFAAAVMLRAFSMSSDPDRHRRIVSSLSLGMIGPVAGGKAIQSQIHQWINDVQPLGWQYQISNDAIINYELSIEKNVTYWENKFLLNGYAAARVGTLSTKLSAGAVVMAGKIDQRIASVFSGNRLTSDSPKKFSYHFYLQPLVNVVGYDATIQGGLFNTTSPYSIPSGDITRFTVQANAGLVIQAGSFYLEYFRTYITKEFATGIEHKWGGLRVGVKL